MSDDKSEGIEQYLSTYQRTETQELVEVTDENLMVLTRKLRGTITFEKDGTAKVVVPRANGNGVNEFRVGDLINRRGCAPYRNCDWTPAETGDLINGGDLR